MPADRVLFDTNAYRYLVTDKSFDQIDKAIQKLKGREKKNNIETLFSPIVAKELLAHVAYKNDPHYERCLKAIKAMYIHNGDSKSYNMLPSFESLLSKAFFGQVVDAKIETYGAIGQMAYHLATNPSKKIFTKFRKNLLLNRAHVLDTENAFALSMLQFVKAVDPTATGWRIFENDEVKRAQILTSIRSHSTSLEIALGYIFITYQLLLNSGKILPLEINELVDRAEKLIEAFPAPIALFKEVMENLVNSEFNILENSRSNFVWDIALMFNVGNNTVQDSKLYFVTGDKAIIRNAIKENAKYSVLTYDEYIEYLSK